MVTSQASAAPAVEITPATATRLFPEVESREQFFGVLNKYIAAGKIPKQLLPLWDDFYNNYSAAVLGSGVAGADEKLVASVLSAIADRSLLEFVAPFVFAAYHERITAPYNYYEFGQRFTRTLIDFPKSLVGHIERFDRIEQQLAAGENVVLLANHQTEADPGVFALLLEHTHPRLAEQVIYVAGDRVVTDALCKPFTMGRNLYCVHSKKHLDDFPELKAGKMAQNRRTVTAMIKGLNEGGKLLWIAPSGGRDRPDPDTGIWRPARFDGAAVELMNTLTVKAKPAGHLYPFAMYTYRMFPPPPVLEKDLGERRLTYHVGVGISVCEQLEPAEIQAGIEDKEQRTEALGQAAWEAVCGEYERLAEAVSGKDAALASGVYSQPWLK